MRLTAIACGVVLSAAVAFSAFAQNDVRDIRKLDDMPAALGQAIGRECDYTSRLAEIPIRIIRPAPNQRLVALVPCSSIVMRGIAFVLARTPVPIDFAVKEGRTGFGVTRMPGYLEWDADTQTLTARMSTDMIGDHEWRHTYRPAGSDSPFLLTRVEHRLQLGDRGDQRWHPYWQATEWHTPGK